MARRPVHIPKTALSERKRASLRASDFAVPSERKYPINDLFHARLALTYVLSPSNAAYRDEVVGAVLARYPELKFWWASRSRALAAPARRKVANPSHTSEAAMPVYTLNPSHRRAAAKRNPSLRERVSSRRNPVLKEEALACVTSRTVGASVEQDKLSGGWAVYLRDNGRIVNMTGDVFATEAAAKREAKAMLAQVRAGLTLDELGSMFWNKHHKPFTRRNPRREVETEEYFEAMEPTRAKYTGRSPEELVLVRSKAAKMLRQYAGKSDREVAKALGLNPRDPNVLYYIASLREHPVVTNPAKRTTKRKGTKRKTTGGRTAAQENAAKAMRLWHSGKASSLAEAWAMLRR